MRNRQRVVLEDIKDTTLREVFIEHTLIKPLIHDATTFANHCFKNIKQLTMVVSYLLDQYRLLTSLTASDFEVSEKLAVALSRYESKETREYLLEDQLAQFNRTVLEYKNGIGAYKESLPQLQSTVTSLEAELQSIQSKMVTKESLLLTENQAKQSLTSWQNQYTEKAGKLNEIKQAVIVIKKEIVNESRAIAKVDISNLSEKSLLKESILKKRLQLKELLNEYNQLIKSNPSIIEEIVKIKREISAIENSVLDLQVKQQYLTMGQLVEVPIVDKEKEKIYFPSFMEREKKLQVAVCENNIKEVKRNLQLAQYQKNWHVQLVNFLQKKMVNDKFDFVEEEEDCTQKAIDSLVYISNMLLDQKLPIYAKEELESFKLLTVCLAEFWYEMGAACGLKNGSTLNEETEECYAHSLLFFMFNDLLLDHEYLQAIYINVLDDKLKLIPSAIRKFYFPNDFNLLRHFKENPGHVELFYNYLFFRQSDANAHFESRINLLFNQLMNEKNVYIARAAAEFSLSLCEQPYHDNAKKLLLEIMPYADLQLCEYFEKYFNDFSVKIIKANLLIDGKNENAKIVLKELYDEIVNKQHELDIHQEILIKFCYHLYCYYKNDNEVELLTYAVSGLRQFANAGYESAFYFIKELAQDDVQMGIVFADAILAQLQPEKSPNAFLTSCKNIFDNYTSTARILYYRYKLSIPITAKAYQSLVCAAELHDSDAILEMERLVPDSVVTSMSEYECYLFGKYYLNHADSEKAITYLSWGDKLDNKLLLAKVLIKGENNYKSKLFSTLLDFIKIKNPNHKRYIHDEDECLLMSEVEAQRFAVGELSKILAEPSADQSKLAADHISVFCQNQAFALIAKCFEVLFNGKMITETDKKLIINHYEILFYLPPNILSALSDILNYEEIHDILKKCLSCERKDNPEFLSKTQLIADEMDKLYCLYANAFQFSALNVLIQYYKCTGNFEKCANFFAKLIDINVCEAMNLCENVFKEVFSHLTDLALESLYAALLLLEAKNRIKYNMKFLIEEMLKRNHPALNPLLLLSHNQIMTLKLKEKSERDGIDNLLPEIEFYIVQKYQFACKPKYYKLLGHHYANTDLTVYENYIKALRFLSACETKEETILLAKLLENDEMVRLTKKTDEPEFLRALNLLLSYDDFLIKGKALTIRNSLTFQSRITFFRKENYIDNQDKSNSLLFKNKQSKLIEEIDDLKKEFPKLANMDLLLELHFHILEAKKDKELEDVAQKVETIKEKYRADLYVSRLGY